MLHILKTLTIITPLGIRFWDPARNMQVRDELHVTARLSNGKGPEREAFLTNSGVYAFQNLPGLYDVEHPARLDETHSPPVQETYQIEVRDRLRRFLTITFNIDLPLPYAGIYLDGGAGVATGSPPGNRLPGLFLFSAPARSIPVGASTVRACIEEKASGKPAAYAVMKVQIEGQIWYGIADERGCLAVIFPTPNIKAVLGGSPPRRQPVAIQEASWEVEIFIHYQPTSLVYAPGASLPELRSILRQATIPVFRTENGPALPSWQDQLTLTEELILRTDGYSSLLIQVL